MIAERNKLKSKLGKWYDKFKKYECFLAGGAITSIYTNTDINDYDIYFRNKECLAEFLKKEISFKNWVKVVTDKAFSIQENNLNIQFIHFGYFNSAEEIFDTFDFTVCMGAFDFKDEKFYFNEKFMEDNAKRRLSFNEKTRFPIVSLMRVEKYRKKGYKISKSEMLRIIFTIMQLKIENKKELKAQIGGMYGERYEEVLKDIPDGEIDLAQVVSKISEFEESENSFKPIMDIDPFSCDGWEEIQNRILGIKTKCFEYDGRIYKKSNEGKICYLCDSEKFEESNNYEFCEIEEAIQFPLVRYKYVRKCEDGLYSFFNPNFKYNVGKFVNDNNRGIYVSDKEDLKVTTYFDKPEKVLIELMVLNFEDALVSEEEEISLSGPAQTFGKVLVTRVVPKEEEKEILSNIDDDDDDEEEDDWLL